MEIRKYQVIDHLALQHQTTHNQAPQVRHRRLSPRDCPSRLLIQMLLERLISQRNPRYSNSSRNNRHLHLSLYFTASLLMEALQGRSKASPTWKNYTKKSPKYSNFMQVRSVYYLSWNYQILFWLDRMKLFAYQLHKCPVYIFHYLFFRIFFVIGLDHC